LRNCFLIASELLGYRCAISLLSLCYRSRIIALSPRNHFATAAEMLRNRYEITAQSFPDRIAIAVESPCYRLAIDAESLRNTFATALQLS
jgi:hypothetical protein